MCSMYMPFVAMVTNQLFTCDRNVVTTILRGLCYWKSDTPLQYIFIILKNEPEPALLIHRAVIKCHAVDESIMTIEV